MKMLIERHVVKSYLLKLVFCLMLGCLSYTASANPWGKKYFPNIELTTHEGKKVKFFDDVIKDKIVAINFIYTRCPDTCPLETAQLIKVQNIMGDRLGKDVHFYSITIDPEHDTPEVMAEYRERFQANWDFLTGDKQEIIQIRKKLGLYIEEIQDGSNNHNVNMIIGNQTTGRWMKRSPFENPYVLADQLGNWLTGWKAKQSGGDYADAPKLRQIPRGEQIFRTRCITCHSIDGNEMAGALGPDLLGVTQRRDMEWLLNWLRAPDQMLAKKDPIAVSLYEKYNRLAMPNMRLNRQEAMALIHYMNDEASRLLGVSAQNNVAAQGVKPVKASFTVSTEKPTGDVVAIMNAWVREAHAKAKVNAGYMTLINAGEDEVTLVKVESDAYKAIEVHEMVMADGMMEMSEVTDLRIPGKGQISFEPGGKHLMMMGPKKPLKKGEQVDMKLTFKSGRTQNISISVASK